MDIHAKVKVRIKSDINHEQQELVTTTVGRVILYKVFPEQSLNIIKNIYET